MKIGYAVAGLLAGGLIAGAAVVHAATGHTIAGASCQPASNTGTYSNDSMSYKSTGGHLLECPIERNNMSNTDGITLRVWSGQAQNTPSGSVCTARSFAQNGAGVARQVTLSVPGYNSGSDSIDYGTQLKGGYGNPTGFYTLECWLNAGAYISMIRWDEP